MENDPWAASTGDDPWAPKSDALASSRLGQFGLPADANGGFGESITGAVDEEIPAVHPWGSMAEEGPSGTSGGWGAEGVDFGTLSGSTLPAWSTKVSDVGRDGWQTSGEQRHGAVDVRPDVQPEEVSNAIESKALATPKTPDPLETPLPDSPNSATPPTRSRTPTHLSPTGQFPHTPSKLTTSVFSPASPSFSDDGGGFGNFSSGLPSAMTGGLSGSRGFGADGADDDEWGKMELGLGEEEPMPSWGGASDERDEDALDEALAGVDLRESHGGDARVRDWDPPDESPAAFTRRASEVSAVQTKEDEWEVARKKAAKREARAPAELVDRLAAAWGKVAEEVCGFPIGEDGLAIEDSGLTTDMMDQRDAYPQPFASTKTSEMYLQTLSQPLNPETSLLARASQRALRHPTPAGVDPSEWNTDWLSRSRLGETHEEPAKPSDSAVQSSSVALPVSGKGRWNLWGRTPSGTVPLTTSGGGMLEIKDLTPSATSSSVGAGNLPPNSAVPGKTGGSHSGASASAPSPLEPPTPVAATSPATAAMSPRASTSSPSPMSKPETAPRDSESADSANAVGRFFGRFKRSRAASPSVDNDIDIDTHDVQLSNDDLGILAQVPAIAQPAPERGTRQRGVGDLLSMDDADTAYEAGRASSAMSLEAVLTRDASLTPPIPQRTSSRGEPKSSEFDSSIFSSVPNTGRRSAKDTPSDLDLLGGMDFSASELPQKQAGSGFGFDAFAMPSVHAGSFTGYQRSLDDFGMRNSSSGGPEAPDWPVRGVQPADHDDGFGDFATTSSVRAGLTDQPPALHATSDPADLDDFGDFADGVGMSEGSNTVDAFDYETPKANSQAVFGTGATDYAPTAYENAFASASTSAFPSASSTGYHTATRSAPAQAQRTTPPTASLSNPHDFSSFLSPEPARTSAHATKPTKPTLSLSAISASENLVASASHRTARWPAPASPMLEMLPPPPSGPGRSGVGLQDLLDADLGGGGGPAGGVSGSGNGDGLTSKEVVRPRSDLSGMDFFASIAPASSIGSGTPQVATGTGGGIGGNGGLSQADLSFFDSL